MKKQDDKKVALKLVNQYADRYKRVEEENKSLKAEIKDLKTNLKINKEIVETFFKSSNSQEKGKFFGSKLREENDLLHKRLHKMKKELEEKKTKVIYYEKVINDSITEYRDSTESLINKIFILENCINKKDNLLFTLNCKVERLQKMNINKESDYVKDIYIVDPDATANLIHDDLMLYKQAHDRLLVHIKEDNEKIKKLEHKIEDMKKEMNKYQHLRTDSTKYENTIIINNNLNNSGTLTMTVPNNSIKKNVKFSDSKLNLAREEMNFSKISKQKSDMNTNNVNSSNIYTPTPADELNIFLKQVMITKDEYEKFIKNNQNEKFVEAMELMSKTICDRNMRVKNLILEMENLSKKNSELNRDNILLSKSVIEMKDLNQKILKENENLKNSKMGSSGNLPNVASEYMNTNASMSNNTCRMDNIMYQQYNNKYLQKFFTNDYDYMPKPKSRNSSNIKNNLNNKLQLNIMGNNSVDDKIQYNFNHSNNFLSEGVEHAQRYLTENEEFDKHEEIKKPIITNENSYLEEIQNFKPKKSNSKIIKKTSEKIVNNFHAMEKLNKISSSNIVSNFNKESESGNDSVIDLRDFQQTNKKSKISSKNNILQHHNLDKDNSFIDIQDNSISSNIKINKSLNTLESLNLNEICREMGNAYQNNSDASGYLSNGVDLDLEKLNIKNIN